MDALFHINELFAQSVYLQYRQKRYGMKKCSPIVDEQLAYDLRTILMRKQEQLTCNYPVTTCCTLQQVEEKINTL